MGSWFGIGLGRLIGFSMLESERREDSNKRINEYIYVEYITRRDGLTKFHLQISQ